MKYGARIALVAALLSITSCSSGPRAPHDPAEQARQVRLFADQLEQHCLDRNLTLDPYPKTSNNYRETDHARSNSCTLWRRARGGSDLDHRFFVYQNQQGLVQELKQRFGVLYHRHIGMIGVCEAGREHFMLLRDGSTVLYIAFSNHAFNGAYCSPSTYGGRWQQVVVRLSKACSFSYQNDTSHYLACG
ncbi:MAG: hypothetical protein JJU30_12565, partial [Alkalimonas sp.]|nr:hypothetical protein [Alkalimonas sp.]